jgi:SAM-dependent methyltransferase
MSDAPAGGVAARGPFQGVAQIVRYNWPFYIVGGSVTIAAAIVVAGTELPGPVRPALLAGLGLALFWIVGSLATSYYVYDRSSLYRWGWIARHFPSRLARWANIHSGLDETTPALRAIFPDGAFDVIDIYDPVEMTEASIRRARAMAHPVHAATPAHCETLPLADGGCDAIFLIFAAHEIRRRSPRSRFFAELRRSLAPDGRVLLVEHLRDLPNFIAFGPGAFHFLPRSEWTRMAAGAGFEIEKEFRITPLVRVFVLKRGA